MATGVDKDYKGAVILSTLDSDWIWTTTFPGNPQGLWVTGIVSAGFDETTIHAIRTGAVAGPIVYSLDCTVALANGGGPIISAPGYPVLLQPCLEADDIAGTAGTITILYTDRR